MALLLYSLAENVEISYIGSTLEKRSPEIQSFVKFIIESADQGTEKIIFKENLLGAVIPSAALFKEYVKIMMVNYTVGYCSFADYETLSTNQLSVICAENFISQECNPNMWFMLDGSNTLLRSKNRE